MRALTAQKPKLVANTRSAAIGAPPLCTWPRTLGHHDDRESGPVATAGVDELADRVPLEGQLRDQDHIGSARDAGGGGDPAGVSPHDLADHHPVMALGRRVELVDRLGGGRDRGEEPDRDLGADEIVVDGLGNADHVDPALDESRGGVHGPVPADHHERVDSVSLHRFDATRPEVLVQRVAVLVGPDELSGGIGSVVAAEDRAAAGQDAGDVSRIETSAPPLDESEEPVGDADHLEAVSVDRRLGDGADRGVEAGAVAACGHHADASDGALGHRSP
jgi:hypothetical protein